MRIIQLRAQNIKRLIAIEITPDKNVVQISGRNGSGKTSVLDAIWWALEGVSAIQQQPIRNGTKNAHIELDMGEIVVERTFTAKGSYLRVTNADGMQFQSPQKVLDKLLGKLSFDPLEFLQMKDGEQITMLQGIAGVDGSVGKLQNQKDFDTRRDVNRDAKSARARADAIEVPADAPSKLVDLTELRAKAQEAHETNGQIGQLESEIANLDERITAGMTTIQRLRDDMEKARAHLDTLDKVDVTTFDEEYSAAESENERWRRREARDEALEEIANLERESQTLTDGMMNRTSVFQAAVAAAELPIDGLGIDLERGVTFNNLPLDQASNAEQIRVSTALAMALNPAVRVLRIREGSLLDSKSLELITEMADTEDYQIWIETVDESGTVGIMLEDGMIVNQEAAE